MTLLSGVSCLGKYKAAMFDMDGTLIDSLADLADSANEVMDSFAAPRHNLDEYRYFVGNGAKKLMERSLPPALAADEATVSEATTRYKNFYLERHLFTKTKPYDGILPMLEKFRAWNIPCAVVTNKPHAAALSVAEKLFPKGTFFAVVGDRDGAPRKPDPTNALKLAKEMRVLPEEVVFFGDSDADMQTAVNAGFLPVGVLWGFRPREELAANGGKLFLANPLEIFNLVEFESPT